MMPFKFDVDVSILHTRRTFLFVSVSFISFLFNDSVHENGHTKAKNKKKKNKKKLINSS